MDFVIKEKTRHRVDKKEIPKALIYEIIDGKPFYYKGYKEVLKGKKTLDDIMGVADIQGWVISCIWEYLVKILDPKYKSMSNEIGFHLTKNTNLSSDIVIFEKAILKEHPLKNKLFDYPPITIIEIDTNADLSENADYFLLKTQKLLDWGVKEVIWVHPTHQKVVIARQNEDWITQDWKKELVILEQYKFSVYQLLKDDDTWQI